MFAYSFKGLILCGLLITSIFYDLHAQETNCRASGWVISENNESVEGAVLQLIHEPTHSQYEAITGKDGFFMVFNLKAGGPYSLKISHTGFITLERTNFFIHLSSDFFNQEELLVSRFILKQHTIQLSEITVKAAPQINKTGIETDIHLPAIQSMPSITRNFQDFVRMVPQARVNGDGVMSLAGQNNRFNAFFIDGANNTDMRGLAVNGMNGGQTGSPPVSLEALEEIHVLLAPYNVQYGNFTGGSINAITRSGTNENKTSFWYFFRNEKMAGRSPEYIQKPSSPDEYYRPRLSSFFNQTGGAWNSGALVRNKLFYFLLLERVSESRPQPYNFKDYRGTSTQSQLMLLSGFLKSNYGYDPGSFLSSRDDLKATRVNVKLDWNHSVKNKFMLSYRLNNSERTTAPRPSGTNAIAFQNSGIILPSTTHSLSFEWKKKTGARSDNRLLFTYTNQADDRKWIGQAFPGVIITDGSATLTFGSESATGVSRFHGNEWGLIDILTCISRKNTYTAGMDFNLTDIRQAGLPGYFGLYQFRNLDDFYSSNAPLRHIRSFYTDKEELPAFVTMRSSFFANNEFRFSPSLKINFGIRLDVNAVPSRPPADPFFNDTAIAILSVYYDLHGTTSGSRIRSHWMVSPRAGFDYKLPEIGLNLKGGAGIFLGHIVNFWLFDVFNSHTGTIDILTQHFYPDPYNQPSPESLSINPSDIKGTLVLIDKAFKYPAVFRSTISAEKELKKGWSLSLEGIITKNIHETYFQNINILPPLGTSAAPGSRNIFSTTVAAPKINFRESGVRNPYAGIYFVTNNPRRKGSAYSVSAGVHKQFPTLSLHSSYTYGRSDVLFEITGPQTPSSSQWRNMETVNGRNYTGSSTSDNDPGHRVTTWITKKITDKKGKTATTLSIFYNGQSGNPYSYVYVNSMINDNGTRNENFDLIYIPTEDELAVMYFVPITDNNGTVLYTADQQKQSLNDFIGRDKYLSAHRGSFSERNGARLPFTHIIDISLQHSFIIKSKNKKIGLTIRCDIFNFSNMLNRKWGRTWFLLNDSYPLITFVNWENASSLIPQYRFTPLTGRPYSLQTSTLPGSSSRWISQLGIKININ